MNRTYRHILIGLGLLVAAGSSVYGQIDPTGTVYSKFGIGELQTFYSSQSAAMGGAAVGLFSPNYINGSNPGSWSNQIYTRLSAGYQFRNVQSAETGLTSSRNDGAIGPIQIGIPILPQKLGVVVAFQPYSRVGYTIQREGTLPAAGAEPETDYSVTYEGKGGLQAVTLGAGYRIHKYASVGLATNIYFGIHSALQRTDFPVSTSYARNTLFQSSTRMSGASITLGVSGGRDRIASTADALTAGLAITLPANLTSTRTRTLTQSVVIDTLGGAGEGTTRLPMKIDVGAAYQWNQRWIASTSFTFEDWANFDSDFSWDGFDGSGSGSTNLMRNRYRFALGGQYSPSGNQFTPRYLDRMTYRLGAYIDQAYYEPVDGYSLKTYALTGGLGLPSLFQGTYMDLNAEVGFRGTRELGLVRDRYYRLTATVNFGERWFVKRKLR